ncbi:MAG: hypothetical protein LBQ05_01150, partial [Christensenellaceae bacterium]|nr:hypothetical protein [Christensenellaceae bacterium]
MNKDDINDLYDDENSVTFDDPTETTGVGQIQDPEPPTTENEPTPEMNTSEIPDELNESEHEVIKTEKEQAPETIDETNKELSADDIEELKPNKTIWVSSTPNYITNADEIVKIANLDLQADREKAEREKHDKPLREKEALRQSLLATKDRVENESSSS